MEHFYHDMRRAHEILMDGDKPVGGAWNFDLEIRKRLPADLTPPARKRFPPDPITRKVISLVEKRFAQNFGELTRIWLASDASTGACCA